NVTGVQTCALPIFGSGCSCARPSFKRMKQTFHLGCDFRFWNFGFLLLGPARRDWDLGFEIWSLIFVRTGMALNRRVISISDCSTPMRSRLEAPTKPTQSVRSLT